jgi:hypothetical protein
VKQQQSGLFASHRYQKALSEKAEVTRRLDKAANPSQMTSATDGIHERRAGFL